MSDHNDEIINKILSLVQWLEDNVHNDNLVEKGKVLDMLAVLSVNLATLVSDAYDVMNELEDEYKISLSQYIVSNTGSIAKLEKEAEATFADKRREWTKAKNYYKRLNSFMERIDRIQESHKQSISVVRQMVVKNL